MVGIMDSEMKNDVANKRQLLLKLMDEKNKIETEIAAQFPVLEQNGVGMDEPLVDAQGFPRNDIDVYRVRHARHAIICLRNDLKAVMKQIEEGLHSVHATTNGTNPSDVSLSIERNAQTSASSSSIEPIARVKTVVPDSPAFVSGLIGEDLIIEFGSVNASNFKSLEDITKVVMHSVNSVVRLVILRNQSRVMISLCPKQWSGRGLLGCTILPVENNVER